MKITLIGSGNMGAGLAKQVAILSRNREQATELAEQVGTRVLQEARTSATAGPSRSSTRAITRWLKSELKS